MVERERDVAVGVAAWGTVDKRDRGDQPALDFPRRPASKLLPYSTAHFAVSSIGTVRTRPPVEEGINPSLQAVMPPLTL